MFFSLWICIQIILIWYLHGGDTIYYGNKAEFNRFEYMACVFAYSGYNYGFCGGVIIDEFHILTAAHCVIDFGPKNLIVIAGRPHINDPFGRVWAVEKIHLHPNFKANRDIPWGIYHFKKFLSCIAKHPDASLVPKHDIAVLKLMKALPLGENITKVQLPQSDLLPYCSVLKYAGWGQTEHVKVPIYLQYTNMIVLDPEECIDHQILHRKSQFCATTADGTSLIGKGDSGNPLVDMNIVYGITSFMWCDSPSLSVVFTKVFNYVDFINDIITSGNYTDD